MIGSAPFFRVEHALGMTTVQNLMPLRFANRMLQAVWNSQHIAEIEVLWEETLALEGRAAFYDGAGALTDVMQNHMMQVFSMVAMEPPDCATDDSWASVTATELRRRKVELLRAVREPSVDDIIATSRRGRYTAGRLADGQQVPDYAAEDGVDPDRNTETFAEVVLAVDNQRWSGTKFRFRAGKALAETRKGILVRFRPGRATGAAEGERLWIGIDGPNGVSLRLNAIPDDDRSGPAVVALTGRQPESRLSPYAHVLLNVMKGGSDLSVGSEEAEQAWRILTPVRDVWDRGLVPMSGYSAGSTTI
jgi:glucose-6-phosphate 1-dehydrogenase